VFFKEHHFQILVNLPVTDVPRCTSSNAKTLGLENLPLLNVAASGIPPDAARIVHHWVDELFIQLNSASDGEATSPVQERAKHTQTLGGFLSDLDDMWQPCQTCIESHSPVTGCIDQLDWLSYEIYRSRAGNSPGGLTKEHCIAL
jgi:hypothetical protein